MKNDNVRVGGMEVESSVAREWVQKYLNGAPGQFGYPSYDGYRTNDDENKLAEGDFLAPLLLNVSVKIKSFADLCGVRDDLDMALSAVPGDVDLVDADAAVIDAVG